MRRLDTSFKALDFLQRSQEKLSATWSGGSLILENLLLATVLLRWAAQQVKTNARIRSAMARALRQLRELTQQMPNASPRAVMEAVRALDEAQQCVVSNILPAPAFSSRAPYGTVAASRRDTVMVDHEAQATERTQLVAAAE